MFELRITAKINEYAKFLICGFEVVYYDLIAFIFKQYFIVCFHILFVEIRVICSGKFFKVTIAKDTIISNRPVPTESIVTI